MIKKKEHELSAGRDASADFSVFSSLLLSIMPFDCLVSSVNSVQKHFLM